MKKILFIMLLLIGCNDFKEVPVSNTGEVVINGKNCKVTVLSGNTAHSLYYVDCGSCAESAVNYQVGKTHTTVIQSPESSCSCPVK